MLLISVRWPLCPRVPRACVSFAETPGCSGTDGLLSGCCLMERVPLCSAQGLKHNKWSSSEGIFALKKEIAILRQFIQKSTMFLKNMKSIIKLLKFIFHIFIYKQTVFSGFLRKETFLWIAAIYGKIYLHKLYFHVFHALSSCIFYWYYYFPW